MSKLDNNNVVEKQFDGIDGVVTVDGDKYRRVNGGIINWMVNHDSSEQAMATDFESSREHRGVANEKDVKYEDLQYAYEALDIEVHKGADPQLVKKTVASILHTVNSVVVYEPDAASYVNDPNDKSDKWIEAIVQLDRRLTPQVSNKVNKHFANWMKNELTGKNAKDKDEKPTHPVFGRLTISVMPAPTYIVKGCKDRDYVKSISDTPYQVDTVDMMGYLQELPQTTLVRADEVENDDDPRMVGKIKKLDGGQTTKIWDAKNIKNFNLLLNAKLPGIVRYNGLEQQLEVTRTIDDPAEANTIYAGVLNNSAITALKIWAGYGGKQPLSPTTRDTREVAELMGHRNAFNPFFDYLNSVPKWDGHHRIERMFIDSLGVDDNAMTRLLPYIVTVGVIYLQEHPGTKMDYVIDVVGEQGVGKTTLIEKLINSFGGEDAKNDPYWDRDDFGWYTQSFMKFSGKDELQKMTGKIYLNDDELSATENSDPEAVKKFATEKSFTYRKAYDINPETYQRTSILWRTTNKLQLYVSKLGQRKFWPMVVHHNRVKTSVLGSKDYWTPAYVDQIWAEALHVFKKMGELKVAEMIAEGSSDPKYAQYRDQAHASLQKTDSLTIELVGLVYDRMAKAKPGKTVYFATQEIIDSLGIKADISNKQTTAKIAAIMCNDLLMKPARPSYKNHRVAGYASTPGSTAAVKESAKAYGAISGGIVHDDSQDNVQNDGTAEFADALND